MTHTLRWCLALARRRAWRWMEAVATDPAARKAALGRLIGIAAGFAPLIWVLPGGRWGRSAFEAGLVAATATGTIWLVLCMPALSGVGITLRRPGLSMVVSGPASGRGLVAFWMLRAWPGVAIFHGVIWLMLARRCLTTTELAVRWAPLAAAAVAATLAALGLVATVTSWHHRAPRVVRSALLALAMVTTLAGATATIRAGFIGDAGTVLAEPWGGLWLGFIHGVLDAGHEVLAVVAAPWDGPAPWGGALTMAAFGLAWLALGLVAGRSLDVPGLFEASARQAEALAEARRRPRGARRPGRVRPFGVGAWALAWKALAERTGRHSRLARTLEWAMLVAASGVTAWLLTGVVTRHHEWLVLGAAAVGTIFGSAMGGTHEAGLGTEIQHRAWLLRYPTEPARLLAVLLLVPWLQGVVVVAVTLAASFAVAPAYRPLIAVSFAAGAACCAAVRALRAWAWLQFPPGPVPSGLGNLLHFALSCLPLTLGAIVAGVAVGALHWSLAAGVALAGMPAALMAGLAWPFVRRAFARIEVG